MEKTTTFLHQFCNFCQDMLSQDHLGLKGTLQELFCVKIDRAGHRINLEVDVGDIAPSRLLPCRGISKFGQFLLQLKLERIKLSPSIFLAFFQPCLQQIIPEAISPPFRRPPEPKQPFTRNDFPLHQVLADVKPELPVGHQDQGHMLLGGCL